MNDNKVGYLFTLNFALGQDKNVAVNGNFAKDATPADMSAELDKVFEALDKQRLKRLELPAVEGTLNDQKDRLEQEKKARAKLATKTKLSTSEQSQLTQHISTIERLEEVIPEGELVLADLRKKAA